MPSKGREFTNNIDRRGGIGLLLLLSITGKNLHNTTVASLYMHAHSELASYRPNATKVQCHVDIKQLQKQCLLLE